MAYSDFNYIRPADLPRYIRKMASVVDEDLAARFISDAELVVDAYAGHGPRFYQDLTGQTQALIASGATTLLGNVFGNQRPNYWAKGGLYVELLDGVSTTLLGQARLVVASQDQQVTLASGFDEPVPLGATFMLHQRSAFPRIWNIDQLASPRLPDQLAAAVAYQVEYAMMIGSEEFGLGDPAVVDGADALIISRTYGTGYSEQRSQTSQDGQGLGYYIAPKARNIMRGLINALGTTGV